MSRGGYRPGSGRKPWTDAQKTAAKARREAARSNPVAVVEVKKSAIESKPSPAIDPQAWIEMLPQIEEISRRYARNKTSRSPAGSPFRLPQFPKVSTPSEPATMAMDSDLCTNLTCGTDAWLAGEVLPGLAGESLVFLGYAYLSELAQRPEYRVMAETIADDATRKWIDFDVVGDARVEREQRAKDPDGYDERMADPDQREKRLSNAGKLEKVKALRDDQLRLEVKDRFYEQCRNDGFFGRSHLFLDVHTNGAPTDEELKTPIGDGRDSLSKGKVPKGSLKRLQTIEPVWSYPLGYNAINPLDESWYNPQVWYVMGKEIHGSRLQTFIGHPVPDMLKPAYAFGGLSLTQMAKPYVDIWLQTRQSVADLIHSFSVMVLMTDLSTLMQPGNVGALLARAAMFNMLRDNNGLFVANKNTEDFKNVSASLSGLHELQAQAQEHMASVHRIPLVKFTGIQPSGLNACLPGDTLIFTERGQVPIRDVTLSDRVMTRRGFAPLTFSGITKYATELIEIRTENATLRCTDNHPIWLSSTNEFARAENVRSGDRLLLTGEKSEALDTDHPWHGAVNGGGRTRTDITLRGTLSLNALSTFTGRCGSGIGGQSPMDSISTTLTTISKTIKSGISNRCMGLITPSTMGLSWGFGAMPHQHLFNEVACSADQASSPGRQAGKSSAALTVFAPTREQSVHPNRSRVLSAIALCAERVSSHGEEMPSFVPVNAPRPAKIEPPIRRRTISRILKSLFRTSGTLEERRSETPLESVSDAGSTSFRHSDAPNYIAHNDAKTGPDCLVSERVVSVRRIYAIEPVYDLTVAPGHLPEFFANGILTHNSSEGEIKVYDDTIMAYQSRFIAPNLTKIINFEQLSLFGEIDPAITYKFMPLREMTQAEKGQKEKDDADRNQKYVDMGALHPAEVRAVIINDPDLPYTELDPDDVPDLLSEEQEGLEPVGGRPQASGGEGDAEEEAFDEGEDEEDFDDIDDQLPNEGD